jgi:hypothetical protein
LHKYTLGYFICKISKREFEHKKFPFKTSMNPSSFNYNSDSSENSQNQILVDYSVVAPPGVHEGDEFRIQIENETVQIK